MTRAVGNRFRTRKLSTKQSLAVLRENQIDSVDDDGQRNIPQIETGVERQEEIEHHLQAAISASQAAAVGAKVTQKIFIPTPNTTQLSAERYGKLYPKRFAQPASYIRFSSTVEDSCGIPYCMSSVDDRYLSKLNSTRNGLSPISEDEFETVMEHYEKTVQTNQPFLSMDVSNIMPYEEMEGTFDRVFDGNMISIAKLIYGHWREQKVARQGKPIVPTLKFEQGNEKDDGDPYVCFRRREVRQVRKTRRTDAQSTDKLKRIRQELETARGLVKDVLQRETVRKNGFYVDNQIFEHRQGMLSLKRKLGIKGDDEDFVNKPKRSRPQSPRIQILPPGGKPPDAELKQLVQIKVEEEKARLEKYNQFRSLRPTHPGVVDSTEEKLFGLPSPPLQSGAISNFCSVRTFYLPSPPPSASSGFSSPDNESNSAETPIPVSIVPASSTDCPSSRGAVFRRRVGRGGRILIDRRQQKNASLDNLEPYLIDRMKYDDDAEDILQQAVPLDLYSTAQIRFRARMLSPPPESNRLDPRRQLLRSPIVSQQALMPVGNQVAKMAPHHPQQQAINGQSWNSYAHNQMSPHFPQHGQPLSTARLPQAPLNGINSSTINATSQR